MYRNDRVLTTGSHKDLVESVSQYGQQLLDLMLAEINRDPSASEDEGRYAA